MKFSFTAWGKKLLKKNSIVVIPNNSPKDSGRIFTTLPLPGGKSVEIECKILHTTESTDENHQTRSFIHGIPLPKGFHIEVSAVSGQLTNDEATSIGLEKCYLDNRNRQFSFFVKPNFRPNQINSFSQALMRLAQWVESRQKVSS